MTAKHTPAPWLIGEDQCIDETWSIVTTTGGAIIANVNDRHDRPANARLISAAPDLLAALERIVFDWDGEPEDMFAARAAIAKARGQ